MKNTKIIYYSSYENEKGHKVYGCVENIDGHDVMSFDYFGCYADLRQEYAGYRFVKLD